MLPAAANTHTLKHTHREFCYPDPIHILSPHGNPLFIIIPLIFLYIMINYSSLHIDFNWGDKNRKMNLGLLVFIFYQVPTFPFLVGFCTIKLKSSRFTFTFNSLDFKSTSQNTGCRPCYITFLHCTCCMYLSLNFTI